MAVGSNPEADDLLTLTVSLQVTQNPSGTNPGMAVIQIVEGIPFPSVTATVSITGGQLSGNPSTTATISKGQTQSNPFSFTFDQNALSTVLSVSNLSSNPSNIEDSFAFSSGYGGFVLAAGDDLTVESGICDRTPQVRDAILAELSITDCNLVTPADLNAITTLDVSGPTIEGFQNFIDNQYDKIDALQEGDFAGLTTLTSLDLSDHSLAMLPNDVFLGLTTLLTLNLSVNALTDSAVTPIMFPDMITTLDLSGNMLTDINSVTFPNTLQVLGLSNNQLQSLSGSIFSSLSALISLDLSGNGLTSLPADLFLGLVSLQGVNLSGNPNAPFTLTITPIKTSDGAFVLELIEGAPTDLTITVTVDGGTVMDMGMTTSTPQIVIPAGSTASAPFMITLTSSITLQDDLSLMITLTPDTEFDPYDPMTGIGYSGLNIDGTGLNLASGICARTQQVQDEILSILSISFCEDVMLDDLEGISTLDLSSGSISSLQAGDFSGLSALTSLDVSDNALTMLPAGVFSGLSALMSLDVSDNDLTMFT